jgi:hypothetical protein
MDNGNWQVSGKFENITPGVGVKHTFYARYQATATHEVSAATGTGEIPFPKITPEAPTSILVSGDYTDNGFAYTYSLNPIAGAEYRMDSGVWQTTVAFSGISPGTSHTFSARYKETATHNTSLPRDIGAVVFPKLTPPAPNVTGAPEITGTAYKYTVSASHPNNTTGAVLQYRMDSGSWQDSNIFTGITPGQGVTHTFYARYKASGSYNDGSAGSSGAVGFPKLSQNAPSSVFGSLTNSESPYT